MADFSANYGDRKYIPEYEQYASTINKSVVVDPYNTGKNSLRDIILCDANQPTETTPLKPGAVLNFRLAPTHNYEISESYLQYTLKIRVDKSNLPYWRFVQGATYDASKQSTLFNSVISSKDSVNLVDYFPLNAAAILNESTMRYTTGCVNVHHDIADYAAIINNLQSAEYMNLHPQTYFKCKDKLDCSVPFLFSNGTTRIKDNMFADFSNDLIFYVDCQIPLNMVNPVFAVDSNYWPANLVSVNEHIFLELKTRPVDNWKDIFIRPGAKLANLLGDLSKDNLNIFAAEFVDSGITVDIIDAKMNVLYKDNEVLTQKLRADLVNSKSSHKLTLLDSRIEKLNATPFGDITRMLNNKYDSVSRIGTTIRVDNSNINKLYLSIDEQKNIQIFSGLWSVEYTSLYDANWLGSTSCIKSNCITFDTFNLYRDGGKTNRLYARELETTTDFYMETLRAYNFNGTNQSGSGSLNLKNYLITNNYILCSLDAFGSSNYAEIPFDGLDMSRGTLASVAARLCTTNKISSEKNKYVFDPRQNNNSEPRIEMSVITIFDAYLEFSPGNLKYNTTLH